jgi:hypothetical protein
VVRSSHTSLTEYNSLRSLTASQSTASSVGGASPAPPPPPRTAWGLEELSQASAPPTVPAAAVAAAVGRPQGRARSSLREWLDADVWAHAVPAAAEAVAAGRAVGLGAEMFGDHDLVEEVEGCAQRRQLSHDVPSASITPPLGRRPHAGARSDELHAMAAAAAAAVSTGRGSLPEVGSPMLGAPTHRHVYYCHLLPTLLLSLLLSSVSIESKRGSVSNARRRGLTGMWVFPDSCFRVDPAQRAVCTRGGGGGSSDSGAHAPAVTTDFLAGGAYERRIYSWHAGRGRSSVAHAYLCLLVAAAARIAADGGGGGCGGDDG